MSTKEVSVWLTIVAIGLTLVGSMVTHAIRYGALEKQVEVLEKQAATREARIAVLENRWVEIPVLRETMRNMDLKLSEVLELLKDRRAHR